MYKCNCCGREFDEPDSYEENMGDFHGMPAYQTFYICPYCKDDDFEEVEEVEEGEEEMRIVRFESIIRFESTIVPMSEAGRRFADEYAKRLKEQGAFEDMTERYGHIVIKARYELDLEDSE